MVNDAITVQLFVLSLGRRSTHQLISRLEKMWTGSLPVDGGESAGVDHDLRFFERLRKPPHSRDVCRVEIFT